MKGEGEGGTGWAMGDGEPLEHREVRNMPAPSPGPGRREILDSLSLSDPFGKLCAGFSFKGKGSPLFPRRPLHFVPLSSLPHV